MAYWIKATVDDDDALEQIRVDPEIASLIVDCEIKLSSNMEDIRESYKHADVVATYDCSGKVCDFSKVISTVDDSDDLKGYFVKQYVNIIVTTIADNPKIFPTLSRGGYIISDCDRTYLIAKNATKGINLKCPKYGIIDLQSFRNRLDVVAKSQYMRRHTNRGFGLLAATAIALSMML